jgi:hypothetical protein
MAPKPIAEVAWRAFRVDKRAQVAWLRDPPQQAPACRAPCATAPAALLAGVDQLIGERREKLLRAERKISDAVGRSAAAGDIDRLRRKAQKRRLRLDEALEDKHRLLATCEHPQTAFAPPTGGAANTGATESAHQQLFTAPSDSALRSAPSPMSPIHQPAGYPWQGASEVNSDVRRRTVRVLQPEADLVCPPCECTDDVLIDLLPSRLQPKRSNATPARGEAARPGTWSTVFA